MDSISPLSSILPVGSATSNSGGKGQQGTPKQGQFFKATVLEARGQNTFILDVGGNKITAEAKMPLSVGQTLRLQVMTTAPQVEMKVVSDSANLFQGKSLILLGNSIDLKSLFLTLKASSSLPLDNLTPFSRQTLESYFLFNQDSLLGKEGGGLLKQFINRLGISFEALLARGNKEAAQSTLKSALFNLANAFKGAEELSDKTNKLLNTIELYQLAQLQLDKDDLLIFPLPIPFLEKGYLIIENYSGKNGNEDDQEDRFSLHLALEGLGNIRIDILKNPEGIFIRFISDDREKLAFLEQFKDDLLLNTVDTTILGVSFSLEKIDPAADLLKRLLPDGESIVNTKV